MIAKGLRTDASTVRGTTFDVADVTGAALSINGGVTGDLVFKTARSPLDGRGVLGESNQRWFLFDTASGPAVPANVFDAMNPGAGRIARSWNNIRGAAGLGIQAVVAAKRWRRP